MIKKLLGSIAQVKGKLPIIYSVLLIVAIPLALILNTWWNLRSFERDMDFAVREKVLGMQRTFVALMQDELLTQNNVEQVLERIKINEPSLIAASVLTKNKVDEFDMLATTEAEVDDEEAVFINQLAWSQKESYFAKTYDAETDQNVWMVISPMFNSSGEKIGLTNFKVSTANVDKVVNRTTRDALIILVISTVLVLLLLINHLRFFEQSLLVNKLKQLDGMKNDFIAVATHELKNPLVVVRGAVDMIRDHYKDNIQPELQEWLAMIDTGIYDLNNLVQDLLNVSRIEQNRLDFNTKPANLSAMVDQLVMQMQTAAAGKGLQLLVDKPMQPVWAMVQEDRMKEVMQNLVGNAIKYTPAGSVTVAMAVDDKQVKLMVKDTGVGIAPEDKEKLFGRFVRIYNDQTKDVPGTGLGLWITKQYIERMQGKIFVDSILGQGTVFTVVLNRAGQVNPV